MGIESSLDTCSDVLAVPQTVLQEPNVKASRILRAAL